LAEARFLVKNNEPELALKKLQSIIKDWPDAEEAKLLQA
jgi:hypothetical protein